MTRSKLATVAACVVVATGILLAAPAPNTQLAPAQIVQLLSVPRPSCGVIPLPNCPR